MYVSMSTSVSVSMYLYLYLYIYLSIYIYLPICTRSQGEQRDFRYRGFRGLALSLALVGM